MSNKGDVVFAECNHIEADTRIVLFVMHAISNGHTPVLVRTSDTDVIIILVGHCARFLNMDPDLKLYVQFHTTSSGKTTANNRTGYVDIVKIASFVGLDYCMGLMLLYAYTGCDYTPSFFNIGKAKWFDEFHKRPQIRELFQRICEYPDTLSEEEVVKITKFTLYAYGVEDPEKGLQEGRFDILNQKANSFRALPPSPGAAIIQARKSVHIAGHIWGKAYNALINPPNMCSVMQGWKEDNGTIMHMWTMQPQSGTSDLYTECRKKCGCRSKTNLCGGRCTCNEANMACLISCKCRRRCSRLNE